MEPRSGGSADTSHLVKQIAFVEIHAETFQNMNKLILEANLLMVFGLIPDYYCPLNHKRVSPTS